ncbi:MAG TPA: class I fructose-bisphosphate aldolase [Acidimicrobiia bacterium]|nr:class I fructose-bisphosphate aldolase [Acidimicrobiia bacterium]
MDNATLVATAQALVAPGKGILAADESTGTLTKRFAALGIDSTADSRRDYRELLFTSPGVQETVSGVILYDETIRQSAVDGTPFPELLQSGGVLPGIKVDTGAKPLAGCPGETVTEGLDGLRERLAEYRELGARFAKWRAVISIGEGRPSTTCLAANAHALARYAALCQEADVVPIVEPEVLMDGDHTIERCYEETKAALEAVFTELATQRVALEGMILKPNMVVPGAQCATQVSVDAVARATVSCLLEAVPAKIPGIAFLSGGQGPELATAHLNAMNAGGAGPWPLTFSFGRALQDPALRAWEGKWSNLEVAQRALTHRLRCAAAACTGTYRAEMEAAA